MEVVDLEKLEFDINGLVTDRSTKFFHDLIARLAGLLDFNKSREWYEARTKEGFIREYDSFMELDKDDSDIKFEGCSYRNEYIKDKDSLIASTHHPTTRAIRKDIYTARSVISNSKLGLENIISYGKATMMYPLVKGVDPFSSFFKEGYLVEKDGFYFFHPKYLYELVEKKVSEESGSLISSNP